MSRRIHFESEQAATAKFYLSRILAAPEAEQQRLWDMQALHVAVANGGQAKGAALLRMRHLCGRPGMADVLRRIA